MLDKLIAWMRGKTVPQHHIDEQLRIITKAARRCAHDLDHAASFIPDEEKYWRDVFHEAAKHWRTVFYPAADGKNYRDHIYDEIAMRDREIKQLRELLAQHNIDARGITGADFPF